MRPSVSVIIPNYNHARYLDRRIQSVLNQSYQDFEVIIIDDKSTDDSLAVITRYKYDRRISSIISSEYHSGSPFIQWARGISLAKGDLIWIAESDDFCERNLLEELVRAFYEKPGCVLAYNTTVIINEDGTENNIIHPGQNRYLPGNAFLKRYLLLENFVKNASCAIFSREAAMNVSAEYTKFKGAGDYMFWAAIATQGNVAIVHKRLSYFLRHEGSVTSMRAQDGTNPKENMDIVNFISSRVHVSGFRSRMLFHHRKTRLDDRSLYLSPDIYGRVAELWRFSEFDTLFDRLVFVIARFFRVHFNYYL